MKQKLMGSWNKFQNTIIALLAIVGLNTFITSFELRCVVNVLSFIMLIAYIVSSDSKNSEKPKIIQKNTSNDVLKDMGYQAPPEEPVIDYEFVRSVLRFKSFTEKQIENYISKSSSTNEKDIISECEAMKKEELETQKKYKFNSKKPSEVVMHELFIKLSDANENDILRCISRCGAKTNEEAIEWCIKEYNSGNYLVEDSANELQMIEDLTNVLMTYKKYNRKEALEIAKKTKGNTLEERIAAAFKAS